MTILVFDVGNVLIRWDPRFLYEKMFSGDSERMEWFLANVCTGDWNLEMDRGAVYADHVAALCARHPEWEAEIRAFDTRWQEMVPGDIAPNTALLERLLARGEPIYAITNFSREKWAEAQDRFPVLTRFEGVVVSAHERLIKPDPAIYRTLLDRYGLEAGRCLFIDDSEKNVVGARAVGMRAIHCPLGFDLAAGLADEGVAI
ncbi:MAG: HAD family hydrolase [Salinarimonas sp.]